MALSMGCVLASISKWQRVIGHAIATGLRTRKGEFIHQSAAIRVPEIPREAVEHIFYTSSRSHRHGPHPRRWRGN